MVVVVLSTVILRVATVHARLTHHQVTRIQAQYAAKAGVIFALEKLRKADASWSATTPAVPVVKRMCRAVSTPYCAAPDVTESGLPSFIQYVDITVYDPAAGAPNQGINGTRKISANAVYTYTE